MKVFSARFNEEGEVKEDGAVAISLPLENLFQRLCRVGFLLTKILGEPILKRAKRIPITRTPDYH